MVWRGLDEWRAEAATVELSGGGLLASGTQIGADYRIDYWLDATGDGFVTRRLIVHASDTEGNRELDLTREAMGDALDCDLGLSPLTNAMPILRHGLHTHPGEADFTMAWVDVPSLEVHESAQRYEHVRPGVVRFIDRGRFEGFAADLEVDQDGLALTYPGLATRA
ncbi:MAG TPA: putative glycolipid-binding domain-containing protein [Thermoleophilaceae bacterium]|nr:putative glycolipid-binding domain-containing protein [Thermoleophilaceae bacterium]